MSESKVILITGASSGIGAATARKLVKTGHRVMLTARSEDKLNDLVKELGKGNAKAQVADAADYQSLKKVVDATVATFQRLDVVFANAGMGVSSPGTEKGDPEEWSKMVDININGLLWTAKLTLPHLRKTQGHFITTSSVAGRIAMKGSVYGATKWFAYGFSQNLAKEMAQWNGRCTTITPGMVNTPFFDDAKPDKLQPEDVAQAVLFAIAAEKRCNVTEVSLMPTNMD